MLVLAVIQCYHM